MVFALAALLAFGLILWLGRGAQGGAPGPGGREPRKKKPAKLKCKWSATGGGSGKLLEYRCATCKAVAYSREPNGPTLCKKEIGQGGL